MGLRQCDRVFSSQVLTEISAYWFIYKFKESRNFRRTISRVVMKRNLAKIALVLFTIIGLFCVLGFFVITCVVDSPHYSPARASRFAHPYILGTILSILASFACLIFLKKTRKSRSIVPQ